MSGKRIGIGARPLADPQAEAWIRQGVAIDHGKVERYSARLTLDVTPALRTRIKLAAFERGVTMAEMLRLIYNTSDNVPAGWYRTSPANSLGPGDLVLVHLSPEAMQWLRSTATRWRPHRCRRRWYRSTCACKIVRWERINSVLAGSCAEIDRSRVACLANVSAPGWR